MNINLVKDLKMDNEKVCVKCEKLQENSAHMEAMYETLVDEKMNFAE